MTKIGKLEGRLNTDGDSASQSIEKLVLGTVQFGLDYGVANRQGKPDIGRVREILDLAYNLGIRVLDTAVAYGKSEAVLGSCNMDRWSVITKLPSFKAMGDADIGNRARETVLRSLDLLGVETLQALLAHDCRDMIGGRGRCLRDALEPLIDTGRIGKLGVSVYAPKDMEGIDAANARVVQAPLNVLDQRFVASGASAWLCAAGGELHVRSVFLQGLLLMPAWERPARFAAWTRELARFDEQVQASGLDPAAFCLGYAASQADVRRCVIGVETAQQLSHLVAAFKAGQHANFDTHNLRSDDPELIDPRRWEDAT